MEIAGRLKEFVRESFPLEKRLTIPEAVLLAGVPIVGHQILFGNPAPASEEKIARDEIELEKQRAYTLANQLAKDKSDKLDRQLARIKAQEEEAKLAEQSGGGYYAPR